MHKGTKNMGKGKIDSFHKEEAFDGGAVGDGGAKQQAINAGAGGDGGGDAPPFLSHH